jgi:predicted amidohydrolase YtcJ
VTHEYVIALGGRILASPADPDAPPPTAIAWAADRVLAVGSDADVRAISRGDSTFLDLGGCVVTPLPEDVSLAEEALRQAIRADPSVDLVAALAAAGLVDSDAGLEPGSPADLAVWNTDPGSVPAAAGTRVIAEVRAGAFTEGDEHSGPLSRL